MKLIPFVQTNIANAKNKSHIKIYLLHMEYAVYHSLRSEFTGLLRAAFNA